MISSSQNYNYNLPKPAFGACIKKSGELVEPIEEIGMLFDIGLQSHTKGLDFDGTKNGFFAFKPAPSGHGPRIYMSENRDHILIENSNDDLSVVMSDIDDSSEQKDLFQKVVWNLFSLVPRETIESINKAKEIDLVKEIKRRMTNMVDPRKNPANEGIVRLRRMMLQGESVSENIEQSAATPVSSVLFTYEKV